MFGKNYTFQSQNSSLVKRYRFWNQLYEDTEFTNKAKSANFRWADSETRKVFLDALGFTIVEQIPIFVNSFLLPNKYQ